MNRAKENQLTQQSKKRIPKRFALATNYGTEDNVEYTSVAIQEWHTHTIIDAKAFLQKDFLTPNEITNAIMAYIQKYSVKELRYVKEVLPVEQSEIEMRTQDAPQHENN